MTAKRISWRGWFSSKAAIFAVFACAPVLTYSDAIIHKQPGATAAQGKRKSAQIRVEKLGSELFNPGTAQKIQFVSIDLMRKQDLINTLLVMQIEHAFTRVEKNVDNYLDWYYSLSGEYTRLYEIVTGGKLDNYIREKLIEHLQSGKPFIGFERTLQDAVSKNVVLLQEHKATVQRILDQNRINLDTSKVLIIERISMEKAINPSVHFDFEAPRKKMLTSGTGDTLDRSMTSIVTGKIMEKIDSMNILNLAAKSLAKFVTARATGSLGGASAGAAIGSAIPGIGTAIGAVAGIVLGGIAIDKGLLTLDEAMNRENFKSEIMGAISEVKREITVTMRPEPAMFFQKN